MYALDVVLSTGDGKPRVQDERHTTVYKRALDKNYRREDATDAMHSGFCAGDHGDGARLRSLAAALGATCACVRACLHAEQGFGAHVLVEASDSSCAVRWHDSTAVAWLALRLGCASRGCAPTTLACARPHRSLKMKASRAVFSEINKKFSTMPFAARALGQVEGEEGKSGAQSRLGLVECINHELLHPYPVRPQRFVLCCA